MSEPALIARIDRYTAHLARKIAALPPGLPGLDQAIKTQLFQLAADMMCERVVMECSECDVELEEPNPDTVFQCDRCHAVLCREHRDGAIEELCQPCARSVTSGAENDLDMPEWERRAHFLPAGH